MKVPHGDALGRRTRLTASFLLQCLPSHPQSHLHIPTPSTHCLCSCHLSPSGFNKAWLSGDKFFSLEVSVVSIRTSDIKNNLRGERVMKPTWVRVDLGSNFRFCQVYPVMCPVRPPVASVVLSRQSDRARRLSLGFLLENQTLLRDGAFNPAWKRALTLFGAALSSS